ncbi:MAG: glycosyltransferase family 2 protein [Anaerolineaceae bacterium]
MPENALVSIITPSYNQARYLEQTMRSVLEQDYPRIEYWVIDGGSSDGSVDLIQRYAPRLAGWLSEKDSGQADAVNKGFARATGEYIAWLNSDDLYYPGALAEAVRALEANPAAPFVFSDVESIDGTGKAFNRMRYGEWALADLMRFQIIGQPGVFMRRSALLEAGFLDTSYHYILDHHLWLRLAALGSARYVPGALWAAARTHPGAKNTAQAAGFAPEALRLADWLLADPRFQPIATQIENQIRAGAHRFSAFYLMEADQPKAALAHYARSFRLSPTTALQDWRRIFSALASVLGLGALQEKARQARRKRYQEKPHPEQPHK